MKLKIIFIFLIALSFISVVSASFTFQGYTKYVNGTNMTNVNISIDVLQFQQGQPPATIATIQNVSNSNAYFNITINNTYDNDSYIYQPSIVKYNSTNGLAEYIGQSLPFLMYDDMMMLQNSPVTFYLKPAITVDLSGVGIEHGIQNNVIVSNVSFPSNYSTGLEVVNESGVQFWAYLNASDCLYLLNSTYSINRTFCDLNITNIQDLEYYQPNNTYYFINTTQVGKCNVSGSSISCNVSYSLIDNGNPMRNYTRVGGIEFISDLNLFYISASNGSSHYIDAYNMTFNRQNNDNSTDRPDFNDALAGKLKYYNGYIYEIMNQSSRNNRFNYNIFRCSIYGNRQCQDTVNFFSGEIARGIARNEFDNKWYYASVANNSIVQLSDPWTTRFNFFYQVKDVALGYPIKETFSTGGNGVTSARFSAPADRNYSIMFYPNNGPAFPSRIDLNGLTTAGNNISLGDRNATIANNPLYVNLSNANLTTQFVRVFGFAKFNSSSSQQNYTNFTVTAYLLEAGNMVFKGATLPQNMGERNWPQVSDVFNTTSGFYNMTLPASVLGANLMLFVSASNNNSGTKIYYGGFKSITLTYGQPPSEANISLYPLIGQVSNLTIGFEGQQNAATLTTALKRFIIQNSSGTRASQAHIEVELNYPASVFNGSDIQFSWMADISDSNNGTLELPLLNYSVKSMQVFSQQYAPKKKGLSINEVQPNPVYFNLSSFQNIDPDTGGVFNDIEMMMYRSGSSCSVPSPSLSSCSLIPEDAFNSSNFNPFSVVLGGGKIDFEMKKLSNNITIRYIDVDLLASGPPDAMFDDSANSSTSGSSMQDVWKFGSQGPSIYSYVLLGVPYNASAINESGDMRINITKFYGESWSAADWQQGVNSLDNLTGTDYVDYNSGSYKAYINGTAILCNSSDTNLTSGICYKDTSNNLLWFKIPHFSGIGPSIVGDAIATTQTNNDQNTGGSSGGGGGSIVSKWVKEIKLNGSELNLGQTLKELKKNYRMTFNVNGMGHSVGITNITHTAVTIEIASAPQTATLLVGETKKFDVNADGYYDLSVSVSSITYPSANLVLKSINEKIATTTTPPDTAVTAGADAAETKPATGDVSDLKTAKSDDMWLIPIIIIIIIAIVVFMIFILRKKK